MEAPDPNLKLVNVFESDNPVALDLAQAALKEAGIDCALVGQTMPEFGFSPIINPISRIEVAETEEAQARFIIEGVFSGESGESGAEPTPEN